jgi:hypothetical protein
MNSLKKTTRIKINVMKHNREIRLIILCMIILNVNIFAQTESWKTEKIDNGKITVKYSISERTDENGDDVPLIEDNATTTDSVSMQNCILLMKDVSRHKEFTDDEVSEKIKTISDNEWIVYYFTDNPWPIPNCDCVAKMTFSQDTTGKIAVFTFTAAPSMYDKKDVKRMTYFNVTYTFKNLGNGKVEITIAGITSPAVGVPLWIIKAAFPDAPADCLRKFIKLAKEKE